MVSRQFHFPGRAFAGAIVLLGSLVNVSAARAQNVVFEWDRITNDAVLAGATTPLVTTRNVALVAASVFDAVNGVDRRYQPLVVTSRPQEPASADAAAIQAAYAALVKLYPTQAGTLSARRTASLAAIATGPRGSEAMRIANGIAWGQAVADAVFAAHDGDGFNPPPPSFVGAAVTGVWRPTTPGTTGAGPQFATMTPWVLTRASQFRLPPPLALASAEYAADFNEVKEMGSATSASRSADGTLLAQFWAGNTALFWNRIASQVAAPRGLSLVDTAHLFAVLNVAMADAGIACWDGKYRYVFWRPVTAITLADADGNAATIADPLWTPLLGTTPAHPEYPSGHSTVSGAAAHVLAAMLGDDSPFTLDSETTPGVIRPFPSFSAALAEIHNARVWGGIHFRTACVRGSELGRQVAAYVMGHALQPRNRGGD